MQAASYERSRSLTRAVLLVLQKHRLCPRRLAVRFDDFRPDVKLIALESIGRRVGRDLLQYFAPPADELHGVFASRLGVFGDVNLDLAAVRRIIAQRHAGRGVKISLLQRPQNFAGAEARRANHHPAVAGGGFRRVAGSLEIMRVAQGNAEKDHARRKDVVPHRFESGHSAASEVVDLRMAVVDLEEAQILDRLQIVRADRPVKIGMINMRKAFDFTNRVDVVLNHAGYARAALRFDDLFDVEAVDVDWLLLEFVADLFAIDEDEFARRAEDRVQPVDLGQIIVVRQDQEVVAVFAVPADDLV